MTKDPLRVVFDCNIFVQMMLNPNGSAGMCKELVEKGEITLFVSQAVLTEVADVLRRPRFKKLLPTLSLEVVEAFIEEISASAVVIANVPEEFKYERDPEDEPYINLAIVTSANYIVSLDKDLLDLMDATYKESREFLQRYPFLKVIRPTTLLAVVKQIAQ
jgi:putative PIN family toxin of toxin-antitoxin system